MVNSRNSGSGESNAVQIVGVGGSLRGWAVSMVIAIPQAFRAFDHDGRVLDHRMAEQLHSLSAEVVRAARQFHARGLRAADDDCQGAVAVGT